MDTYPKRYYETPYQLQPVTDVERYQRWDGRTIRSSLLRFEDRSYSMPNALADRGYALYSVTKVDLDPYVIYDPMGCIVYEFPEDAIPTWQDVFEVCTELGL